MRKNKRCLVLAALLFCFLCFPADQVLAASDTAEVPLTVRQSFEVKNPEKDLDLTGTYAFQALDAEAPMPEGTKEELYSFSLNGEQAETTISLQYGTAGIYQYQLFQTTEEKESYQYDRSCYEITVYVKNGSNGQLIPQVIVEKADGKKYGELEFQNAYQGKEPEPSKPSKPGGEEKPDQPGKPVKTGDAADMTAYVMIAGGALLLAAISYRKRQDQKTE